MLNHHIRFNAPVRLLNHSIFGTLMCDMLTEVNGSYFRPAIAIDRRWKYLYKTEKMQKFLKQKTKNVLSQKSRWQMWAPQPSISKWTRWNHMKKEKKKDRSQSTFTRSTIFSISSLAATATVEIELNLIGKQLFFLFRRALFVSATVGNNDSAGCTNVG